MELEFNLNIYTLNVREMKIDFNTYTYRKNYSNKTSVNLNSFNTPLSFKAKSSALEAAEDCFTNIVPLSDFLSLKKVKSEVDSLLIQKKRGLPKRQREALLEQLTEENADLFITVIKAEKPDKTARFNFFDIIRMAEELTPQNQAQFMRNLADPELANPNFNWALHYITPENKAFCLRLSEIETDGQTPSCHEIHNIMKLKNRVETKTKDYKTRVFLGFTELKAAQQAQGIMPEETSKMVAAFRSRTGINLYMDPNLSTVNISLLEDSINLAKMRGLRCPKDMFLTKFLDPSVDGFYEPTYGYTVCKPLDNGPDGIETVFHELTHHNDDLKPRKTRTKDKDKLKQIREFIAEAGEAILSGKIEYTTDITGNPFYLRNGKSDPKLDKITRSYKKLKGPEILPQAPIIR